LAKAFRARKQMLVAEFSLSIYFKSSTVARWEI